MANFKTHLNVSAFVSGISVATLSYAHLITPKDSLLYFFGGIIGGILPDIDHNKSIPIRIMQIFFTNLIAFLVVFKFMKKYPLLNLLFIWIISYLIVSLLFLFFKKVTLHRGIIHSIPTSLIVWFLISIISYRFFNLDIKKSYLLGFFVFIGYITHLVLDEIYSIDITGEKIKKSFGSALKLWGNNSVVNFITYSILFILLIMLPQKGIFLSFIKGIINV